jgi:hypothetical protein
MVEFARPLIACAGSCTDRGFAPLRATWTRVIAVSDRRCGGNRTSHRGGNPVAVLQGVRQLS